MQEQTAHNIGLFILRLAVGVIFVVAGFSKLVSLGGTAEFFAGTIGLPIPMVFTVVVMAIELIGGLMLIVGVYTRVAAGLLAAVMLGALLLYKGQQGFQAARIDIALLGAAVALAFTGAGKLRLAFAQLSGGSAQADAASDASNDVLTENDTGKPDKESSEKSDKQ